MKKREGRKARMLAERLRSSIGRRRAQAKQAAEQARLERERLLQARLELLEELANFGRSVGYFQADLRKGEVRLAYEGRVLRFSSTGDQGDIEVSGDNLDGADSIRFQPTLERWVWCRKDELGREQQTLLFDGGLEELVARALCIRPLDEEGS